MWASQAVLRAEVIIKKGPRLTCNVSCQGRWGRGWGEEGGLQGGEGVEGVRAWMVALRIPASYRSHGTRHCVINVGQSVPPLFTCMLRAYSKTKVYQCIYALIDTHKHRLCVHYTCQCSTVRRISQIFDRKKRATVMHTFRGPVENHNHTKEQH